MYRWLLLLWLQVVVVLLFHLKSSCQLPLFPRFSSSHLPLCNCQRCCCCCCCCVFSPFLPLHLNCFRFTWLTSIFFLFAGKKQQNKTPFCDSFSTLFSSLLCLSPYSLPNSSLRWFLSVQAAAAVRAGFQLQQLLFFPVLVLQFRILSLILFLRSLILPFHLPISHCLSPLVHYLFCC